MPYYPPMPLPRPRSMLPAAGPTIPAFGAQNPFMTYLGDTLSDLSYGLATSPTIGTAFGGAAKRAAEQRPERAVRDETARSSGMLRDWLTGPDSPLGGLKGKTNTMLGIGAGFLSGDLANVPLYAMQGRTADMAEGDRAKAEQQRASYAEIINGWGPQYSDIAEGIARGAIDPGDGYWKAIERRQSDQEQARVLQLGQSASGFIKDPDLAAAVAAGALSFQEAIKLQQSAANGGGDWGSTVMIGRDANGQPVPLRAAPGGGLQAAPLPDGVTFDPGGMAGARTSATIDAKTAAAARAALPGAQQALELTTQAVEAIRNNPNGVADQFGNTMGIPNRAMYSWPGSDRSNLSGALGQLQGQAFLQARQMLKGGGQITDVEGLKAEQAIARIQRAVEMGDQQNFLDALNDFEDAVASGYQKLQAAAAGEYAAPENYGGFSGAGYGGGGGAEDLFSTYGLEGR